MTIDTANRLLNASLCEFYDEREAASIGSLVMERLTGMPKNKRLLQKSDAFTRAQEDLFQIYLADLLKQRPVQYVLGEAWFGNMAFYVDEGVLIPRPETEELVNWLLKDEGSAGRGLAVWDIGTGSGCIAVCLKKKRADFRLMAFDISGAALEIAKKNSRIHEAEMDFILCDIRDSAQTEKLPAPDLIISNPPYVPEKQKASLDIHIRDFEPAVALFSPDDDPILYYKIIGEMAIKKLRPAGAVFLEVHHDYAREILNWFGDRGFLVELKTDFSGNNRMIKARLP